MLKRLSYLNILFAFTYFITYLQAGSYYAIVGLIFVIIFNWLTLKSLEQENYKWTIFQYITVIPTVIAALFFLYSSGNMIYANMSYNYISLNFLFLEVFSVVFGITLIVQIGMSIYLYTNVYNNTRI
jgi:hypothetical protein